MLNSPNCHGSSVLVPHGVRAPTESRGKKGPPQGGCREVLGLALMGWPFGEADKTPAVVRPAL